MDPLLEHLGIPECKRVAAKGALGRLARGELKGEWNRFKDGIKEPLKNPKPGQRAKWLWNVALAGEFLEAWLNRDSET